MIRRSMCAALALVPLAWQAIAHGGGLRLAEAAKKTPTLWQSFLTGLGINLLKRLHNRPANA